LDLRKDFNDKRFAEFYIKKHKEILGELAIIMSKISMESWVLIFSVYREDLTAHRNNGCICRSICYSCRDTEEVKL